MMRIWSGRGGEQSEDEEDDEDEMGEEVNSGERIRMKWERSLMGCLMRAHVAGCMNDWDGWRQVGIARVVIERPWE
ncbi:hypothetical protein Pcinc_027879 [Petrolisthes cinctipes]|uniref:Uncharacterized protein n=1 Tax=Petrolisthes cinctipes TaxID=88211 RepID=A0AAE1K837_PETCI|nr:hypothetical protein Pcinc_027879 [Petrolisthes cinctipes]